MCDELGLLPENAEPKDYSLSRLRELISTHPAFNERSNLGILGEKYGVSVKFSPKYHCEINPIESLWCFIKQYVRKHTDQTYGNLVLLIDKALENFKSSDINGKLWSRFWQAINMYDQNILYSEIIKNLYGNRTAENVQHRQIYNTML